MFEVLRTTRELEAFETMWRSLWNEDPNATPFQHPDWLLPWWHQFGQSEPRAELQAVVVRRKGKPVAFLPFYLYLEPLSGERQLLPVGVGTSDYLDGIFAPGCGGAEVGTALNGLREEAGWDTMIAGQLRPQSALCRALELASGARPFLSDRCWRMPANRITNFPPANRHKIINYRNRAARVGALELRVAGVPTWEECFDELVRLHTTRWRDSGRPGVLADARVLAWHREAIPRLQASGLLRLYSLCARGEILAVAYSLVDPAGRPGRTLYYYLPAYALARADLHPGTLLLGLAIENAAEEGVEWIDLLRGDEAYKKLWHAEARATYGFSLRGKGRESQAAA